MNAQETPFIDAILCTDKNLPRSVVHRCVVFNELQARQAFDPTYHGCPDVMLCVNAGKSLWVDHLAPAIEFFRGES